MRRKPAKVKKRSKISLTDAALQALRDAVAGVVADHRRRGLPLAIWRDGQAVLIPAGKVGKHRDPDQAKQCDPTP